MGCYTPCRVNEYFQNSLLEPTTSFADPSCSTGHSLKSTRLFSGATRNLNWGCSHFWGSGLYPAFHFLLFLPPALDAPLPSPVSCGLPPPPHKTGGLGSPGNLL